MNHTRLQQIEAIAICVGGLVLLFEITNAVRLNVWWIGLSVLGEHRFALYLWASVALAVLFVIDGAVAIRQRDLGIGFVGFRGPFAIVVVSVFIVIAHGWRIRTDVAPIDAISGLSDLPIAVRILADPWLAGTLITLATLCVVLFTARAMRKQRIPAP